MAKRHPGLILKFGGHAMAAGLSIMAQQLEAFQTAFEHTVRELVCAIDLAQTYLTDGSSLSAADITLAQAQHGHARCGGKALHRRELHR